MKAMVCPQCGGKIDMVPERTIVTECSYCGAVILLQSETKIASEPDDNLRVPLEDYKPLDDYGRYPYEGPRPSDEPYPYELRPSDEPYDTTFEEYAGTLNKTGFKVIGISAAICFGLFVVIIFGVVVTSKKPTQSLASTPYPLYQRTTTPTPAYVITTLGNSDAISLPKPVMPKGLRMAETVQIAVVVSIDETGSVYDAQAYNGPNELQKAAIEAAKKARFRVRADHEKSSGVLTYDFGPKQ
jgi:DNA-directed RNA polymerase subunit RPC12/RpoP